MIDSHAHILNEYYDNIYSLIIDLKEKNVINVINCADNINTSKEVIESYDKYDNFLLPAVGIHPQNVYNYNINELEELIKNNKVYAIGEIGLDYYYDKESKDDQIKLFNLQLGLAEKYKLPIIVHTRDSIQDCFDILKKHKLKGVIHCFSGSYEMAKEFIKIGYKLGIGGVLTFKNSKLYEVIEKINLKDILLETDSPYLSPEPYRGKKNNPYNIYYVAKKIAEIKNISIDEVINETTRNCREIFDI
ncbi:MAG: TatD family hydrolase [Bacilli bacterium]|nr:TatD family hydrolase [Bacilli bacterium]